MDYLAFIARVTSHIPDKGQVMIRYFGLCKAQHNTVFTPAPNIHHEPLLSYQSLSF